MGRPLTAKIFAADFETTCFENQDFTEVWAAGIAELNQNKTHLFNSISGFFDFLVSQKTNCIVYFHNLKFDGSFILDYLLIQKGFTNAFRYNEDKQLRFCTNREMPANSVKYIISDSGLWYSITVKIKGKIIQFRDSYKILPFPIRQIAEDFGTSVKKLDLEYEGERKAGQELKPEEEKYLINDVIILKEALEFMEKNDSLKITIGAACISEFKKIMGIYDYEFLFPDLTKIKIDPSFGSDNADEYIRKSYRGGYCYLVPEKAGKIFKNGLTLDNNSLYSYEMDTKPMPVGYPKFYKGLPPEKMLKNCFVFLRIKCKFDLKKGMLPTIQIKNQFRFTSNEYLTTTDFYDLETKKYYEFYEDNTKEIKDTSVILNLTMIDFEIMKEHYNFKELEILDSCVFQTMTGIFSQYIQKYKSIKENAKNKSYRTLAKLFLNNLAGKMATNQKADYKVVNTKEKDKVHFQSRIHSHSEVVFIPIGSAITAYARRDTIAAAQANYYGPNKAGFIYSDTDSIHCNLPIEKIKGIEIHKTHFGKWKIESRWNRAKFLRQKTYIEIEPEQTIIKASGMPSRSKQIFIKSLNKDYSDLNKFKQNEIDFIKSNHKLQDFKFGLVIPGKLIAERIPGGTVLKNINFELQP